MKKHTFNYFHHYLTETCGESFLISPCAKNKIQGILVSIDKNKATGVNIIPVKILELAKKNNC